MVYRDPETGKFVSGDDGAFDGIEVATFNASFGVEAADLDGSAGFAGGQQFELDGAQVIDYDEIVDRNEKLVLLEAQHHLLVYLNSTATADGTAYLGAEVSAAPTPSTFLARAGGNAPSTAEGMHHSERFDDSIDVIGRQLRATATSPITDGATGVGGGGSAGDDSVVLDEIPGELAEFHPRDELFVNALFEVDNVDDNGIHGEVSGQHIYGVVDQ